MTVPLIALSYNLKSSCNATQKWKLASLDRRARDIMKSAITSIEKIANPERTLFVKKCLCRETNDGFNKYFQILKHKYTAKNNSKSIIKIPQVKL